jgi:hypothetical protein
MHPTAQISMAFDEELRMSKDERELNPLYLGIHLEGKHDFWCAIPPCSDVFCHQSDFFASGDSGFDTSGQTKVANLEVAIGIK